MTIRTVLRDPNLPHQPVLENTGNKIIISCNCRRVRHGTKDTYEPIGITTNRTTTKDLYNQPGVHRGSVPFGPMWEIHYPDEEPWMRRTTVTVNDQDEPMSRAWTTCWVCGAEDDHGGVPHGEATGDGISRYDIVALMSQGGYTWRGEA